MRHLLLLVHEAVRREPQRLGGEHPGTPRRSDHLGVGRGRRAVLDGARDGRVPRAVAGRVGELVQPDDSQGYFAREQVALWGVNGFWDLPHYPMVPYYRLPDTQVTDDETLFEFIVPMYPAGWLETETVADYTERLQSGETPTAVALSVLDVRRPEVSREVDVSTHWCLAHFLLDGHHKMNAAAATGRPLRLLSFLAVNAGVSTPSHVEALLGILSSPAGAE